MIGIFWVSVLFNAVSVTKGQLRSTNLRLDGYRLAPASSNKTNDNSQVVESVFSIGYTYDLILFGEGIGGGQFVLTKTPGDVGNNCNNYGHTNSQYIIGSGQSGSVGLVRLDTSKLHIEEGRYYFCVKNQLNKEWTHAGGEVYQTLEFREKGQETILPVPSQIILIIILLCLSGTFSGLNLGLMALDPQQLRILVEGGNQKEKKWAKKVLPCREKGNFLLCALLLGNVLVNNTLTIFLDDLTSGTVAIVGATFGIVIFGEIIPQAICCRHGLMIGYKTLPLTYIFMIVTSPMAWPLGKLLDKILGNEDFINYSKARFLGLIKQGKNELEEDEKQMIEGALKLNEKTVKDVMTQISYVFTVPEDGIVDYDFMSKITEAGYSRIPVTKPLNGDSIPQITGLLFLRDLVMVDPDDKIQVSTITSYYKHQLMKFDENTKLDDMLENFKKGGFHLSLVTREVKSSQDSTTEELVGIVTLEDILEEIICAEIVDETDKYMSNRDRIQNTKRDKLDPQFIDSMKNWNGPTDVQSITFKVGKSQLAAIHRFLVAEVNPFSSQMLNDNQIKNMLSRNDSIVTLKRNDSSLINRHDQINSFMMIISGRAEIYFSSGELPIEVGAFWTYGIAVLLDTSAIVTSDFDLKITSDEFIYLNIRRDYYKQLRDAFEIKKASLFPSPVDTTTTTITVDSGNTSEGGENNEQADEQSASNTEQFESVEPEQREPETDEKTNLLA